MYSVKEIFYSLQGEGQHTGRPAVFCRFAGCNLWSGREQDRSKAICQFCDTDFVGTDGVGGGKFASADALAAAVAQAWPGGGVPYVICTGGEPLLQLDVDLIQAFHQQGFEIGLETNGTLLVPAGVDWICVSPKAGSELVQQQGDELKLIVPQIGIAPEDFANLNFQYFFLQAMDNAQQSNNLQWALAYCLHHPQWHLSLQTHKIVGIS